MTSRRPAGSSRQRAVLGLLGACSLSLCHETPPPQLWHALLFFTTGEVVRHHLGADYVPYAHLNGLYAMNPEWAAFEPVMKREWTPYLEHRVDLQTALRQLVAGYVPPATPPHPPAP